MARPGQLGAVVLGVIFTVALIGVSYLPAMNDWRDPYDACITAANGNQVVVGTEVRIWPAGVECRLARSLHGEGAAPGAPRATEFVGYDRWFAVVQLTLLGSAVAVLLAAIWRASARRTSRAYPYSVP